MAWGLHEGKGLFETPLPKLGGVYLGLIRQVGAEFDDPMSELVKLKQTGGVVEF